MGQTERKKPGSSRLEGEIAQARQLWAGRLHPELEQQLRAILERTGLQVSAGEVQLLDGNWYVNHAGLLRLSRSRGCAAIETELIVPASDAAASRWVVKATVFKRAASTRGFVGYGDAHPGNVSACVRGAELRVAETRAVNRALRKAYAVGLCSTEEMGATPEPWLAGAEKPEQPARGGELAAAVVAPSAPGGAMPIGDRLKLLIREYRLDPRQMRDFACRFLGVAEITAADVSELQRFAAHVEQLAVVNRVWLDAELGKPCPSSDDSCDVTPPAMGKKGSSNQAPIETQEVAEEVA